MWITKWQTIWKTTRFTILQPVTRDMSDKPPSRERYEEENPVVSFRISLPMKEKLDELVQDLESTKKDWFESVIQDSLDAYETGYSDGYDQGREDYRLEVPCAICGEPVFASEGAQERIYDILDQLSVEGPFTATSSQGKPIWRHGHKECYSTES